MQKCARFETQLRVITLFCVMSRQPHALHDISRALPLPGDILSQHTISAPLSWYLAHLRQNLSRPKDCIDPPMRSGVVYSIPCTNCNYTFIGETGRHLSTRIKQHRDAVRKSLTDRLAVAEHVWSLQHSISWDEVEILDQDPSTKIRKIKEALHICRYSNLMNREG